MVAINNTLPRAEGEISRVNGASQVETVINTAATAFWAGAVVVSDLTNDKGAVLPSSASTDRVIGIVARDIRQGDTTGAFTVAINQPASVVRDGYIIMKCTYGTPVDKAKVFYRYTAGGTGTATRKVGSIETAAVTNEVIELVGASFNGTMDGDSLVEVRVKF